MLMPTCTAPSALCYIYIAWHCIKARGACKALCGALSPKGRQVARTLFDNLIIILCVIENQVWSEPSMVEAGAHEFADTQRFLDIGEQRSFARPLCASLILQHGSRL